VLTVSAITLFGLLTWQDGDVGWFARAAVAFVLIALLYQMYLTDLFWRRSMNLGDD
jgi:3-methyladenine DNA glycosylase AlkD